MMTIMQQPTTKKPKLEEHPSVIAVRARGPRPAPKPLSLFDIRKVALECGADDAGVVSLDNPAVAEERDHVLRAMPAARSLIAIVSKMHPDNVRSPKRSVANLEFHTTGEEVDAIAKRISIALSEMGHPTINPAMAFPMEMDQFPGRSWIVSHKRVAVAAQLGKMGLHRNLIHPRFGSFILLGTVITSAEVTQTPASLDFDPCVSCKLCVAACPVGAIEPEGEFRFSACYDHNYREFMSGFADVLENVVESRDKHELRERVSQSESASMWQSLAYKPNYKAANCIAVCPAGEDLLAPFLEDRSGYLKDVVKPLTEAQEPVYVVAGSDAEAHVKKRFPHKRLRVIQSSLRPAGARAFFRAIPLTFQRGPARGWKATYHFDLTGEQAIQATVTIDDGTLTVNDGLVGDADIQVRVDGNVWLDIVSKKRSPVMAVLTGKLKTKGDRSLLDKFAACFPR
jgi:epoxyqueuosine reductase QueG